MVATQHAKIVALDGFKIYQAILRVANVPVDLATKPKVPRHAMRCLLVRTLGMAHFEPVTRVIFAKVKPPIKPLAHLEPTPPTPVPSSVFPVHQVRLLHQHKPLNAQTAPKGGFKKKKARTNAIHRNVAASRRVVRHRWSYRKDGTVPIAARTTSAKNQNLARKARKAAKIERVAFLVRRAPPVLRGPRRAFHARRANLLR